MTRNNIMNAPELDGTNFLQFYYIDLFDSVCRVIQDPTYADKLYHAFEMQTSSSADRVFQKVRAAQRPRPTRAKCRAGSTAASALLLGQARCAGTAVGSMLTPNSATSGGELSFGLRHGIVGVCTHPSRSALRRFPTAR